MNGYGNNGGYGGGQGNNYGGGNAAPTSGDPFSGMETVNPEGQGGVKLQAGAAADVRIERIHAHRSQRDGGTGFLVEYTVVQSNSPQDPPESARSWRQDMRNENVARPAVKAFINALLGISHSPDAQKWLDAQIVGRDGMGRPVSLSTALTRYAMSTTNPFQGFYLHVDTEGKKTQRNFDFLKHNWTPFGYERVGLSVPDFNPTYEAARAFVNTPQQQAPQNYGPPQGQSMQQQQNYGPPQGQQPGFVQQPPQQQQQNYGPPQGMPPQGAPPQNYGPPQGQPMQQQQNYGPPQGAPQNYGPPQGNFAPPQQAPQGPQGGFAPPPQGPQGGFAPPPQGGGQGGWGRR